MRVNGSPSALPPPSAPRADTGDPWSPVFGDLLSAPRITPPVEQDPHPDPHGAERDSASVPAPLPAVADSTQPAVPAVPHTAGRNDDSLPGDSTPSPTGPVVAPPDPPFSTRTPGHVPLPHPADAPRPEPIPDAQAPATAASGPLPGPSSRSEPSPEPATSQPPAAPEPFEPAHREGASLLYPQRLLPQGGLSQLIRDADVGPSASGPAAPRPAAMGRPSDAGARPVAGLNRPLHLHASPFESRLDGADLGSPGEADPLAGEGGAEAVQVARRLLVALPWAPKLLRLAVEGDGTVSVWIRDYSLDPSMIKQLVQSVRRAAADGETPSLQRILVNGQLAWSSQQGDS